MAFDDMKKLVDLDMLDRYHKTIIQDNLGGSASVSTIKVTTSEASLEGKDVTITDGAETLTGKFVGGVCTFKKVKLVGLLTISSTDGETVAQTTLDVQSYGIHTVNLTFKYVMLDISTTEPMLYGQKVTAYLDGIEAGAVVLSGSGTGQIRAEETGTYTLKATASGFKAVTEVKALEYFNTYSAVMVLDYATVNITTTESTLVGQVVRLQNLSGNTVATGVFDNNGSASINTDQYGNFTVSATDGEYTAQASVAVVSGQTSTVTLRFEYSTIHVTTTDPLLDGATVTVTQDSTEVGSGVFSSGECDILVHSLGAFTVSTEAEGFSASANTSFTEYFKTNNVTLNLSYATINVSTSETALYGRTVTVGSKTATLSDSGTATVYTNTLSATNVSASDADGNTTSVTVTPASYGQSYNAVLSLYRITFTTTESTLAGQTITFANGSNTKIATFVSGSAAIVFGEAFVGACTATATDGTDTASETITVVKNTYTYTQKLGFGPEIVTFANGTDEQLKAMLDAHYAGTINIHDYWKVGDKRTVSLTAMAATGVGESHVAQDVTIVLVNKGGKTLSGGDTNGKECAFIWQQENCLANGTTGEWGYMNSSNTNTSGWTGCARRTWCNNIYYKALPATFRAMVKSFTDTVANGQNSVTTSTETILLPSEMEVQGTRTYSLTGESGALTQWDYYKTAANKVKKAGPNGAAYGWWLRSPYSSDTTYFCCVSSGGSADGSNASNTIGIAPAGCL